MILSFDASLPVLSVAVVSQTAPVAAIAFEGRESRNEKLLPAIEWLLRESDIDRASIRRIAVTRGPGSFTGVRIGLASAEGLALALGIPICAMPTHEAIAAGYRGRSVLVTNDAGRGELYVSAYKGGDEALPHGIASASEVSDLRGQFDVCVDAREAMWERNIALLAAERALNLESAGRLEQYSDTTPIYVRLAEAEAKLLAKNG
ncbi:MAG: tRNA (adenosine(37)-N6)-threonylcarbamoyltransferase complex dimerization subunit type 1 TsaB [Acidobacteria bacterium]|nr:tRNA (adenosine(37)-N6)-threonylcarbamoyltransferase complex dimerization subunit type 1 TsaB [Acidobacteriota bacterium]